MVSTKLYIFITASITLVGGAELYIASKVDFLKKNGWDVIVISARPGKPFTKSMDQYSKYIFKYINYSPFFYTRRKRENILRDVTAAISSDRTLCLFDQVIIESSSQYLSLWGELLASKINAFHYLFFLSEKYRPATDSLADFYKFKLNRSEFACIREKGIQLLLSKSQSFDSNKIITLSANEGMPVTNENSKALSSIPSADFNILIIGRLEKSYVLAGVQAVVEFAKKYTNNSINLIVVGEESTSSKKITKALKKNISKQKNISAFFTGNLFPIPKQLFEITDVAIACSGCATITAFNDVPVITVDAIDNNGIGYLGYSTDSTIFRKNEPPTSIESLLEKGLKHDAFGSKESFLEWKKQKEEYYSNENVYKKHLSFVSRSKTKEFYNFSKIKNQGLDFYMSILLKIFGYNLFTLIKRFISFFSK